MRHTKDRIDTIDAQVGAARPVQLGVSAAPSGALGSPAPYDPSVALASALSGLSPGLHAYVERRQKEDASEQIAQGERARAMQEGPEAVAMTPEQDPHWQIGYMKMHGQMRGMQDSAGVREEFEQERQKPGFNFDGFIAQKRKDLLAGMNDKDALAGYLPQIQQTEAQLRSEFVKQTVDRVREERQNAVSVAIGDAIQRLPEASHEEASQHYEALMTQAYQNGIPKAEFTRRYIQAIVQDPHTSPADFDHLYAKDSSGVAPAYRVDERGNTFVGEIERARKLAEHREDVAHADKQREANVHQAVWLDEVLDTNPMAISDPKQFVIGGSYKGGPYAEAGAASSTYERILTAQAKYAKKELISNAIRGLQSLPYGAVAEEDFKHALQDEYRRVWGGVDPNDAKSIGGAIQRSMQMHEAYGLPDPHIKEIAQNTAWMGESADSKGNPMLSTQFRAAYAIWQGLRKSNNPQLELFPKEAEGFLRTFESGLTAGMPEMDAFQLAKKVNTKEARDRQQQMFRTPDEQRAAQDGIESFLTSSFRLNDNGFWPTVKNAGDVSRAVMQNAREIFGMGGITAADAVKQAQDTTLRSFVYDGFGSMVRVPLDAPRAKLKDYLSSLVSETNASYKATHDGADMPQYSVSTSQVNGETVFQVLGPVGNPMGPPRSLSQLDQAWLKAKRATPELIAQDARSKGPSALGESYDKLTRGDIDSRQYGREVAAEKARQQAQFRDQAAQLNTLQSRVPQFPAAQGWGPGMREPIPQPQGPELSPKDIALKNASASPDFALTAYGEGFRNSVYKDSAGHRTIGLGYNLDARDPTTVRADLKAAGVTDPARLEKVIAGTETITPDEAKRLYDRIKPGYVSIAKRFVGDDVWNILPDNRKAALTDIAYNAGGNAHIFGPVVDALKSGDINGAAAHLKLTVKGEPNLRRMNLILAMWESPDRFSQLVHDGV